jgi:exopolysaccharide biosynthesis polyprenyl glycosylphosphotransferase
MIDVGQKVAARPQARLRHSRRLLPVTLAVSDAALIYLAFVLAYWTRYSLKLGPQIHDQLTFDAYQPIAALLLGTMMPVLLLKGAYRSRLSRDVVDEIGVVFSAATTSIAAIVVVTAMLQKYQYSRGVIVYLWVLLIVVLTLGRGVFRAAQNVCYRYGLGVRRLLVVGGSDVGKMIMQRVVSRRDLGYDLVGFVEHQAAAPLQDFGRFRAVGRVADIPDLIERRSVDEIILALPASSHEQVWPVLTLCEGHGVGIKLVPDLFEMSLSRVEVDDIAGIPLLDVREKPARRVARAAKRLLDLALASVLTLVTLPILTILALLVRLESRGPALLRQERVGMGGRTFTCLKLRTMYDGSEDAQAALEHLNEVRGHIFKIRDDPRCTRMGRWMRRWSLDELPQIWNVLLGDMSMVGPRPPLPAEVAKYDAYQMRRLEVKPGMTGIWQVSGRSDLPFDEMVVMDIYYVDNWSLSLDIRILVRTVIAVLGRHGAY